MTHSLSRWSTFFVIVGKAYLTGATFAVELRSKGGMVRTQAPGTIGLEDLEMRTNMRQHGLVLPMHNSTSGIVLADVHDELRWVTIGHRFLGLVLALLNISLSSVGFILQRKACLEEVETPDTAHADFHFMRCRRPNPLWLLGVTLYVLAAVPDLMAYTLIPQVLCSSVGCFRVVMVSMLGYSFLGESLKRREVAGIGICTFGALLCIRYGPNDEKNPENLGALHQHRLTSYVIAGMLVLGVLLIVVHMQSLSKLHSLALPSATALAFGLEKVFNSELAYVTMPPDVIHQPLWLSLVGGVALFGLIDFYLNLRAAQLMPLYVFVPLSFAFGALVQNFQSLIIFSELVDMKVYCAGFTLFGVALALLGALIIQPPTCCETVKHQH